MDALENQLKEARFLAEEADKKYDEVAMDKITWLSPIFVVVCFALFWLNCVDENKLQRFLKSLNVFI